MDETKLRNYIERLEQFEQQITNDEDGNEDIGFINELEGLIGVLGDDLQNTQMKSKLQVKLKKIHPKAVLPTYSKDGDAGMDLTITSIETNFEESVTYGFGISIEIPKGYVGLVFPRSSIRKYELSLSNAVAVIDSGYRGEIMATFRKINNDASIYGIGDRGAQIMILPYPEVEFILSDELSNSERSTGGFGSTGS